MARAGPRTASRAAGETDPPCSERRPARVARASGTEGREAPGARSPRDSVPASEQKRSAARALPLPAGAWAPGAHRPPEIPEGERGAAGYQLPHLPTGGDPRQGTRGGPASLPAPEFKSTPVRLQGGLSCKTPAPEQLGHAPSVGGSSKAGASAVLVPPECVGRCPAWLSTFFVDVCTGG